jgi:molybdopterin adenylyltransferase
MSQASPDFVPLNIAVLAVSDTRTAENDTSGDLLALRLGEAGHALVLPPVGTGS